MDKVTPEARSRIMSLVRSKDTKLEDKFRKALWKTGIRYRKNPRGYYGKPDLAIKIRRVVIFVDSCFWHGCDTHCRLPKSNDDYWLSKIERNKKRDEEVARHYKEIGWKLIRVWEHDIVKDIQATARRTAKII